MLSDYVRRLPVGSHVRVRLLSGESFKAVLMQAGADDVIVQPRTRTPRPQRHIPFSQIDFVDLDAPDSSRPGKVAAIAVTAAAATIVGIIFILRALYND